MKKNKNRGKKTLTAMSAVVAAGLTPGIIAATPACMPVQTIMEITAADVVAFDGNTYGFDELYAMQQRGDGWSPGEVPQTPPQVAVRYGSPPPPPHATYYGVPRPVIPPQVEMDPMLIELDTLQWGLMDYCAELIDADARGIIITLDSDLTRELGMDADQLKEFAAGIEGRYDVPVSYHRFYLIGQLNTLRLVSEYIFNLIISRN